MTKNLRWLTLMMAVLWAGAAMAQDSKVALPMVAGAAVPLYPPLARAANVQGVVHVKITTDGHRVIATHVEDGHKLLATAADANAKTWEFATHDPTTFTVTYHYKLDAKLEGNPNNPTVILRLPTEVEVSTVPLVLDTAGTSAVHEGGHAEGAANALGLTVPESTVNAPGHSTQLPVTPAPPPLPPPPPPSCSVSGACGK